MTDYSKLSDYQINKLVAGKVGGFALTLVVHDEPPSGKSFNPQRFDPCNSWSDAGPIIESNGIGIYFIGEGHHRGKWGSDAPEGKPYVYGDRLLRNAMIAFLMMKDAENANP